MPSVVATHDRTSADYQQQWDNLVPQGYRPISLSVYGAASDPRYAAVWVQRSGPAFAGIHGVGHAGFQTFVNTWAAKGYSPTIIAATGPADAPVFAAVMELEGHGVSLTRHGLSTGSDSDQGTIEFWLAEARRRDWIPRWIAAYGTTNDRRYAIVLDPNPGHVVWSIDGLHGENAGTYQQRFDAQRQQWARPAFVTVTPDGGYLSLFRDDSLGDDWAARHGLTSGDYQREADTWMPKGLYPAYVQAGGAVGNTRFATFFARQDRPLPRVFRATGPAVPSMHAIDDVVEERMRATGTRATAVAVTHHGRLVYARGFTWGEAAYPTTQPTSMFRLASCSKPITAMAIFQLVQEKRLSLEDRLVDRVGFELPPGATRDARFANIRIKHLLTHSAGWENPPGDYWQAAQAFGQANMPVSKRRFAGYMASRPMQFAPGTKQVYSNLGYMMLGLVVESLRGSDYTRAVQDTMLTPLGLTRPHRTPTRQADQRPGAARQHDGALRVGPSAIAGPAGGPHPLAALPYGGEDYALFDSFGGWCMAPVDYAKLLAAFALGAANPLLNPDSVQAMWTVPPVSPPSTGFRYTHGWASWNEPNGVRGFEHGGAMPGVATRILLRTDGWGYAIFSNGGSVADIYYAIAGLPASAWPTHDLFPQYGIPAYQLPTVTPAAATPIADHRPAALRGEAASELEPLRAA
ncbi:serine hydrolase [Solirubrobacter ginsenosidimutans]|uniref:Serine hydrolase n=1 Tax=Solirubrobacter ginsenosidimutans TaxID=490573 RepID=A0A9X3N0A1_9ACTN|nr:serine hydrolase [Solirubrobacter ginsenosidimutans]MDA0166060.1 serine hydrolase [Solirubrobacter ginsenosidimutans]